MTGPVTTEALVAALADYWRIARRWPLSTASDIARDLVAGPLAPLLAALQQVTAERDEARDLAYELKLAAAGGEDVPGSANLVTVEDVRRWQDEYARLVSAATSELARLRAEGEAKDRALKPFAGCAGFLWGRDDVGVCFRQATSGTTYLEPLTIGDFRAARAATAREGA